MDKNTNFPVLRANCDNAYIINITACSLYFIKYISIDYAGGIYGLLATIALLCLLYILITLRYHSDKLRLIFSALDTIHREDKAVS